MKLEGVFGLYHLIYFLVSIFVTVGGLILIKKKVKDEKTLKLIFRIIAALLLVVIIVNRIAVVYDHIYIMKTWKTWWALFPETLCGLGSFVLSITVLISPKKNNLVFYYILYLQFLGAVGNVFYPAFLNDQPFHNVDSWTGLLHHSISLFLILLIYIEGYFTPSIKKFYVAPLGYVFTIIYGLFNISVFDIVDSMNIRTPLLENLKILTSWYMIGIIYILFVLIFTICYEYYKNKKNLKEINK